MLIGYVSAVDSSVVTSDTSSGILYTKKTDNGRGGVVQCPIIVQHNVAFAQIKSPSPIGSQIGGVMTGCSRLELGAFPLTPRPPTPRKTDDGLMIAGNDGLRRRELLTAWTNDKRQHEECSDTGRERVTKRGAAGVPMETGSAGAGDPLECAGEVIWRLGAHYSSAIAVRSTCCMTQYY
ncbi:hypothetical protein J6590_010289 [Homalodisca vitripennis]|nr:hypothetical protein J6590_010289 [Homalodisca vitripennis]